MNKEQEITKTIRVFVLISAANQLCIAFTMGTYVLFLRGIGLTPLEVNLVNVAFYVSRFLLEVPTGVIADRYGRKVSCCIAFALYGGGMAYYWIAQTFWECIIAEVILAVGATCFSGAYDAWATHEVRALGADTSQVHRLFRKREIAEQAALLLGAPLGGFFAWIWGMGTPWLLGGVGIGVVFLVTCLYTKESRDIARHTTYYQIFDTTIRGIRYAAAHKPVRMFLWISVWLNLGLMVPNMQWAPTFAPYVGEGLGTGMLFTGVALMLMFGARLSPYLLKKVGCETKVITGAITVLAIGLISLSVLGFPWSLGGFALYELAYGVLKPVRRAGINNAIETEEHATVLSCDEMVGKCAGAIGLVFTGALVQYGSPQAAWLFGGLACLVAAVFAYKTGHHSKESPQ